MSDHTDLGRQTIARLRPHWRQDQIGDLHYMPGGYSNHNFRFSYEGQDYVVRVPFMQQAFVDRQHEQAWYNRLPHGIGIELIALDVSSGAMISKWMAGSLLADVADRVTSADLLRYLKTLHQRLPDPQRRYDVGTLCDQYWSVGAHSLSPSSVSSPCHNDLNPANIIVTEGREWVTLDWESVGNNDPLFDLVGLYYGLERPRDGLADLATALAQTDQVELRLRQAELAYWYREYAWANYQLKRGFYRSEFADQAAVSKRRLRELGEHHL